MNLKHYTLEVPVRSSCDRLVLAEFREREEEGKRKERKKSHLSADLDTSCNVVAADISSQFFLFPSWIRLHRGYEIPGIFYAGIYFSREMLKSRSRSWLMVLAEHEMP